MNGNIPSLEMDENWGYPYDSGNHHMIFHCHAVYFNRDHFRFFSTRCFGPEMRYALIQSGVPRVKKAPWTDVVDGMVPRDGIDCWVHRKKLCTTHLWPLNVGKMLLNLLWVAYFQTNRTVFAWSLYGSLIRNDWKTSHISSNHLLRCPTFWSNGCGQAFSGATSKLLQCQETWQQNYTVPEACWRFFADPGINVAHLGVFWGPLTSLYVRCTPWDPWNVGGPGSEEHGAIDTPCITMAIPRRWMNMTTAGHLVIGDDHLWILSPNKNRRDFREGNWRKPKTTFI